MNWLNDLNNAMDLIEERLPGEVSLEEIARAAGRCYSSGSLPGRLATLAMSLR